jgi:hypothetical protein
MKRLLISVAALTVICSAMLLAARLGGSLNKPLGMSILEANLCDPQPCWQGIRPGEISPDQAMTNLRRGGALLTTTDSRPCWYMLSAPFWLSCVSGMSGDNSRVIDYIDVRPPPGDLRLGDALLQFGEPIGLGFCHVVNSQLPNLPQRFVGAFISFRYGVRLLAYHPLHLDGGEGMIDPGMIVWEIFYTDVSDQAVPFRFVWRGFTRTPAQSESCTVG